MERANCRLVYNQQVIKWPDRYAINQLFYELFTILYGEKIFSIRRILTSCISSFMFVIFFYWLSFNVYRIFYPINESAEVYVPLFLQPFIDSGFITNIPIHLTLAIIFYNSSRYKLSSNTRE